MRSALANVASRRAGRQRSTSLSAVPPARTSSDYLPELAAIAASILYRSPLPSQNGLPVYIVNAAAFPDAFEVDFDSLLPYVLARLPGEDELLSGTEYEVIFFAGGQPEGATTEKKQGPGIGWYVQAYHVLSRATRKKLQRLYIVHPRTWVRVLVGVFGTVVSPKFRRKIVHVNTLTALAMQMPVEKLLIPPAVFLHDRKLEADIDVPYASGRRAFGARHPLPKNLDSGRTRLPRVLRETTSFLLLQNCVRMEGLFRIPPHSVLAGVLKEAYDRGQHFLVWKEKGATLVQPGISQDLVSEVRLEEAYGAFLAASLIKTWYRDLRDPIFHESSYEFLRQRYSSPDVPVTPEDLVDIILPASDKSPLTPISREILTRHLLPMLSAVASHEASNKMNAENLAICFAMTLVCGSNQMEDAKMTTIIRRVIEAAIDMWPQLREGLGISEKDFLRDIQPPADSRDYEDPLDAQCPARNSDDDAAERKEGHRIVMADAESPTAAGPPTVAERAPALPPRPPRSRAPSGSTPQSSAREAAPPVPRRKPAPEPPRYSMIFHQEDNSDQVAESPATYTPSDAFATRSLAEMSADENSKKGFPSFPAPSDPHPALNMPKRKAVHTEQRQQLAMQSAAIATYYADQTNPTIPRSASESSTSVLARTAAQKAASNMAQQQQQPQEQRGSIPEPTSAPGVLATQHSTNATTSSTTTSFAKPTWPASRPPASTVPTLATPILPSRARSQEPRPITMAMPNDFKPPVGRPRAPGPGLLKRMSTIDLDSKTTGEMGKGLQPRKLNLKKASVDDLRRLYEERGRTASVLAKAGMERNRERVREREDGARS